MDLTALVVTVLLTLGIQPYLLWRDTLVSLDSARQFYPWYAYLGQSLRAGHVPGWNPFTFSGMPFAADPLSGWSYLPAMVFFTLFPLDAAAKVYLVFHPVLAACTTYALARMLGVRPLGAVLAGVAYASTGYFQVQNSCCFAFGSVYAWLPLPLLAVEGGLRSQSWLSRGAWWGLAALGLSQIFAGWLGQGSYYAASLVGAYGAYRTLMCPPWGRGWGVRRRLLLFLSCEAAVFGFAVVLAAAGLLPRLDLNAVSNLAGGYDGVESAVGGLTIPRDWLLPTRPGFWYAGVLVLVLAAVAVLAARGRLARPVWFFAATSLAALILTAKVATPLHEALYLLLPGFARLHPHAPERIMVVAYLGPAVLAGAASTVLESWMPRLWRGPHGSALRLVAPAVLVALVATDLAIWGSQGRTDYALTDPLNGADKLTPVDLAIYYRPDGVARFLQQQLAGEPWRFFGYAPNANGERWPYTTRFRDPETAALLVDNQAVSLGLQDLQGYDPQHLASYDAFLTALNGQDQNYHDAEILSSGLTSPLLNLLGARYVVVPSQDVTETDQPGVPWLKDVFPVVYRDDRVEVLENPHAFPRAWIVHTAIQVPQNEALALLASGQADGHATAVLEEAPPPLDVPADPSQDDARVVLDEPDHVQVQTTTSAAGLLVLSQMEYPAWKASVDGQSVPLDTADGALSAVPVPVGTHQVDLRYESTSLTLGIAVSTVAALVLVALAGATLVRAVRRRRRGSAAAQVSES